MKETTRLETFSDGVFAIAMTLLVLEIGVPQVGAGETLLGLLLGKWPSYLAYAVSFLTIAVMWINHHHMLSHIERTDNGLFFINALLLMVVTFLNYPTAVLAQNFGHPGERTAALFYAGTMLAVALLYNVLWRYAAIGGRLLAKEGDRKAEREMTWRYAVGPISYAAALGLALVSVPVSLGLQFATALFFAFTRRPR